MQARIIVSPDGEVSIFVESGTFATAKPAIERLLTALKAQGLNVDAVTPVERHSHDTPEITHQETNVQHGH